MNLEATPSRPRSRSTARRWLLAAGLLPIALGGFAALSAYEAGRLDLPEEKDVALVNGTPVSLERFNRLLAFTAARVTTKDGRIPDADALLLKNALVQRLIDEAVTDAAAKEQSLGVSEKDIDAAFESFEKSFQSYSSASVNVPGDMLSVPTVPGATMTAHGVTVVGPLLLSPARARVRGGRPLPADGARVQPVRQADARHGPGRGARPVQVSHGPSPTACRTRSSCASTSPTSAAARTRPPSPRAWTR